MPLAARTLSREQLVLVAHAVIARGGLLRCRVHGYSMRPCIRDGEVVVLGPLQSRGPTLGDIVLVETPRGTKLHRVVERGTDAGGEWLRVRGDTQVGQGAVVRPHAVCARVLRVDRSLLASVSAHLALLLRRLPWPASKAADLA